MEDVLVYSETYKRHINQVEGLFELVGAINIALNAAKIVFAHTTVVFGGYVVDTNGF